MWDFDAARRERQGHQPKPDPVRFLLGGETFTLLDAIPLGATLDLHDAPEPSPSTLNEAVVALVRFIDRVLIDEDRERFKELLRRRNDPIDGWDIIELGDRIARHFTNRPTVPSSDSSAGRPPDGETSSSTGSDTPVGASST